MTALEIEIWSDIACPWCWIGKRELEAAIELFDSSVTLRWNAFELNPGASREAPERVDYTKRLAEKYGVERDEAQQMIDRIVARGRDLGLDLHFDRIRPTNTFDAHRLLARARGQGRQTELKEALFNAYFREGRLISDPEVLTELAEQAGLDRGAARELLAADDHAADVRDEERRAARLGITGVPCFLFPAAGFAISGAQPAEALLEAMRRAAKMVGD